MKVESLLQNCTGVIKYPYPHVSIKNALSNDYYEELYQTLPSWKVVLKNHLYGSPVKSGVRRNYNKVKQLSSVWKDFSEFHTSNEFYQEWLYWFGPYVRKLLPRVEETYGELENMVIGSDITITSMLCINGPMTETDSVRPAHLDNASCLGNGMFYMADPTDTAGGDLQLYECDGEPVYGRVPANIKAGNVQFPIQKVVSSVPYEPNRYMSFLGTPISVHGTAPRTETNLVRTFYNTALICNTNIIEYK